MTMMKNIFLYGEAVNVLLRGKKDYLSICINEGKKRRMINICFHSDKLPFEEIYYINSIVEDKA